MRVGYTSRRLATAMTQDSRPAPAPGPVPELRLFGDLTERFARIRTFKLRPHDCPENLPPCATGDFVEVTTVEYRWVKNPGRNENVATVGVFLPVRSTLGQWLSQEEQRRQYIRAARRKVHVDPEKGLAEPEWVKWKPKPRPETKLVANENVAVGNEPVEATAVTSATAMTAEEAA